MQAIFVLTTIATLVAFSGAAVGLFVGGAAKSKIIFLVNAALGALLAVTIFDIFPDAKDLLVTNINSVSQWVTLVGAIASGWGIFWLIGKYIYPVCPACSMGDHTHKEAVLGRTLILMMFALGVHSTMDGAAVVIGNEVVHGINLPVFFGITFHKFPEGLALCLLLIGSGYKKTSAFGWTLLIESTTELGALAAVYLMRDLPHLWLGLTFANIGGGFLFLVLNAFNLLKLPSTEKPSRLPVLAGGAAFAVTGVLIVVMAH